MSHTPVSHAPISNTGSKTPRYYLPIILSLVLHAVVITLLCTAASLNHKAELWNPPPAIEAELVAFQPKPQPPKVKKATHQRPSKPVEQRKPAPSATQAAARKAAQQKRDAWLLKQREIAKKKKREAAEKKRKIAEQKAKEEAHKQQQKLLDKQFAQQIQSENDRIAAAEQAKQDAQQVASYRHRVGSWLKANWSVPLNARETMKVTLELTVVPTGEIINTKIMSSSGDSVFDQSAIQAVRLTARIPVLQTLAQDNPRLFEAHFRKFSITFIPKD